MRTLTGKEIELDIESDYKVGVSSQKQSHLIANGALAGVQDQGARGREGGDPPSAAEADLLGQTNVSRRERDVGDERADGAQGRREDRCRIQPRRRSYTPSCSCSPWRHIGRSDGGDVADGGGLFTLTTLNKLALVRRLGACSRALSKYIPIRGSFSRLV